MLLGGAAKFCDIIRRADEETEVRVLVALDDSIYSRAAIEAVKQSYWPQDTEFCICSIIGEYPSDLLTLKPEQMSSLMRAHEEWQSGTIKRVQQLQIDLQELFPLCPVYTHVDTGPPSEQIIQTAIEWEADLIVLGSHGLSGYERAVLGSVAELVVSRAPCTVKIIRSRALIDHRRKYPNQSVTDNVVLDSHAMRPSKILVCSDGSTNAMRCLEWIENRVWDKHQEFRVLNVIEDGHSVNTLRLINRKQWDREQKERLSSAEAFLTEHTAHLKRVLGKDKLHTYVMEGDPEESILVCAQEWPADLIVLGADGETVNQDKTRMGGVAQSVVNKATCSVVVVRESYKATISGAVDESNDCISA